MLQQPTVAAEEITVVVEDEDVVAPVVAPLSADENSNRSSSTLSAASSLLTSITNKTSSFAKKTRIHQKLFNVLSDFDFFSFQRPSTATENDDETGTPSMGITPPHQFTTTRTHLYYYPPQAKPTMKFVEHEQQSIFNQFFAALRKYICCKNDHLTANSVLGVPLRNDEHILYISKPHLRYTKNVLILFFVGLIFFSLFSFSPLWLYNFFVLNSSGSVSLDNEGDSFLQHWLIYQSIVWLCCSLFITTVIYMLVYRLLYIRLYCVRYILTNFRAIITGTESGEEEHAELARKKREADSNSPTNNNSNAAHFGSTSNSTANNHQQPITRRKLLLQMWIIVKQVMRALKLTRTIPYQSWEYGEIREVSFCLHGVNSFNQRKNLLNQHTSGNNANNTHTGARKKKQQLKKQQTTIEQQHAVETTEYQRLSSRDDDEDATGVPPTHSIPHATSPHQDEEEQEEEEVGSIYFGCKIENYTLPFSVISYVCSTGFIMVPNVYHVLDILLPALTTQQQARLVRQDFQDCPHLKPFVIARTNAFCGFSFFFWCCFNEPPATGKISEDDWKRYKGETSQRQIVTTLDRGTTTSNNVFHIV